MKPHIRRFWLRKDIGYGWIAFEHRLSGYVLCYDPSFDALCRKVKTISDEYHARLTIRP